MQINLSLTTQSKTARTCPSVAFKRAEHLFLLNSNIILEACVGPSLKTLEIAYSSLNLTVYGNDIDPQWKDYYPSGKWIIQDILTVNLNPFDAVVFAPPLSHGCTGKREDALSIDDVFPRYVDFLHILKNSNVKTSVLVLPGKSMSSKSDRTQLHHLLYKIKSLGFHSELIPMRDARNRITKYYDVYLES